ncbi:MAG: filament integrity protein FraC [Elainellaceae cyanobacterium]
MTVYLLPLKVISTQALLLLFVIAIESVVLRRRLKFSPRKSVEYAMSLNLLSLVLGWFAFFAGLALLANSDSVEAVETDLINLLFLNGQLPNTFLWIVIAGFITFFLTVFIEILGFVQLQQLRGEREEIELRYGRRKPKFPMGYRREPRAGQPEAKPAYAILIANATSYSLMLIVLITLQIIDPLREGPLRLIAPDW